MTAENTSRRRFLFTETCAFVAADSSGESESSDDSDIEKETASALFMVNAVACLAALLYLKIIFSIFRLNIYIYFF